MGDFVEGRCDTVTRGRSRHNVVCGNEFHGVRDTVTTCAGHSDLEVAVVVHGWSDEPAELSMCRPCATLLRAFMDDNFGAQGGERGAIVVEDSENLIVRRQFRVDA